MPIPQIPGNSDFDNKLNALGLKVPSPVINSTENLTPKAKSEQVLASLRGEVFGAPDIVTTAQVKPFNLNELDVSGKYPLQALGYNNEDLYGQGQGVFNKAWHGLTKMAGLAGTTFLQGTAGLVYGVYKAIDDGRFASIYDNPFNRSLDDFNKKLEVELPNYYTEKETNAAWYSPDNLFTANFFWDKIIKNLGFSFGALAGGVAWGGAIKALGITSKLTSLGYGAEAAATAEEALSTVPQAQKAAKYMETVKTISDRVNMAGKFNPLRQADRFTVAAFGTFGEAGIEALNNMNEFRTGLINQYKTVHGVEPSGDDLRDINSQTDNVGNWSFGLNTVLLTGTNYVQLPRILGSSYKGEKTLFNKEIQSLKRDVEGKFSSALPQRGFKKIAKQVYNTAGLTIAPIEGFEEGSQYTIQTGTQDYFNKKYRNEDTDFFSSVKFGVDQTVGTKEGIENILIGALSGGLQTSGILTAGRTGKISERGVTGYGGEKAKNTVEALQALNSSSFKNYIKDQVDSANRAISIQEDRAEAIRQGEILESKDLEFDYSHNYLQSRIKWGKYDSVEDDINLYKNLAATAEGFDQLKQEGIVNELETKESFLTRLTNFQEHAVNVKSLYESLNTRYAGIINKDTKERVYSDKTIDKMVYTASKVADYDTRLSQISSTLAAAGVNVVSIDEAMKQTAVWQEGKPELAIREVNVLKSITDTVAQISNLDIVQDAQDDLKQSFSDYIEIGLRRKQFLADYKALKERPQEFIEPEEVATIIGGEQPKSIKIKTKDGEEDIDLGIEYYLGKVVKYDRNGNEVYRFPRLTVLGENTDGTIQVKDGNGQIRNISKDEFSDYKLGKVSDVSKNENANFYLRNINKVVYWNKGKDKGGKKPGRLVYNSKTDKLYFVYVEGKKVKELLIGIDSFEPKKGFKEGLFTFGAELTSEDVKDIERRRKSGKTQSDIIDRRSARIQIIEGLIDETGDRIDRVQKDLSLKQEQLNKTIQDLQKLNTKIEAGDLTKRGNFKASTRNVLRVANRLSNLKDSLETEIQALTTEKEELEFNLEYFYDLAQNIDELPTGSQDFIDEINDQAIDLAILIEETGKSINQATVLLDKTESALETAIEWIRENIKLFEFVYPKAPTGLGGQEFINFTQANPNFLKLKPEYREDLRSLEELVAEVEDIQIIPNEKEVKELTDKLKSLQEDLTSLEKQYKAKEAIIQRFVDIVEQYKKAEAQRIQAEQDAAMLQRVFGTKLNQPSTDIEVTDAEVKAERESPKKKISNIASTIDESQPVNSVVATNVKRHNSFLNNVSRMSPEKAATLRMTLVNKDNAPEGIMDQALAGYDTKDYSSTVVSIYSNENGNFVDVEGNPTTDPTQYVISVMASDSLKRGKEDRYAPSEDTEDWHNWYKNMRTKWLSANEPEVYEFYTSSGIPQRNTTNTSHNVTENLIDQSELGRKGLIQVSIDGTINVNGVAKKYTPGRVVLVNGNSSVFLNNRNFTDEEAAVIYEAFKNLAATEKGQKWNSAVIKYLRDVMLFGDPSTGEKPKAPGRNQFWVDNKGRLNISNNGFHVPLAKEFLILPDIKEAIIKIIKGAYQNVSAESLKSNKEFIEVVGFSNDGIPKTRVWQSYQHYLLSPTYQLDTTLDNAEEHDKKRSNVPLTNNLQLPVDGTEPFIQKYSTVVPREDEVFVVKSKNKVPAKEETTKKEPKAKSNKGSFTAALSRKGAIPSAEEEEIKPVLKKPGGVKMEDFIDEVNENAEQFVATYSFPKGNNNMALRLMSNVNVDRMSEEDHQYFKQWMIKNLHNVPVTVIDRLIDVLGTNRQAWGQFTNRGIEIYEHAEAGTEFHEAFEAVWNILLDEADQVNLYEEFINSKGSFFDRSTLATIDNKNASFEQAKEAIADQFSGYMKNVKSLPRSTGLVRFFRWLKDLINSWIGSKKNKLFHDIHGGKFSKKQKIREFNGNAYSQVIPGTDSFTTREIVEDLSAHVAFVLLGDKDSAGLYSTFEHISANQLFKEVKLRILGDTVNPGKIREMVFQLKQLSDSLDGRQKAEKIEIANQINHAISVYNSIDKNWESSVAITKEFLRSAFKIKITEEITMDEKENKNRNEYVKNDFLIDTKQNSTSAMKLLFATLIQTDKSGKLIEGTIMPEPALNSYGGTKLVHSGKAFIDVMKNLINVNTLKEQLQKLYLLGKNNPDYVRLYTRLKGNISEKGELDYNKMNVNDWKLIFDFYSTFAKQAPTPFIIYNNKGNELEEGETFMAPADLNTLTKLQIQQWIGNLRAIAKTGNAYITKTKVGKLKAFSTDTSSFRVSTGIDHKSIIKNNLLPKLSLLGVVIDRKIINKLTDAEANKLREAAQNFIKEINIKDAISITAKNSGVQGRLNQMGEIVVRNTNLEQKSTFFNIDNEQQQIFINDNFYSKFANTFNNVITLDELLQSNPQYNDILLGNSLLFKRGGTYFDTEGKRTDVKIDVAYINGVQLSNGRNKSVEKLNLGERLLATINTLINGYTNIIMPGDSVTEWMISMKNNISMEDMSSDNYSKKVKSIFSGYLVDEMNLIVDTPNRSSNLYRIENKLRLLEGILPEDFKKQIYKFTKNNPTPKEVTEFVSKYKDRVEEAVDKFITDEARSLRQGLLDEGKLRPVGNGNYIIDGLDSSFERSYFSRYQAEEEGDKKTYSVVTDKGMEQFLKYIASNYAINNTEILKSMFGDTGTFKSVQDTFKRIKSHGSPRKSIASGEEINSALNVVMNNADLQPSDYGYTNFDDESTTYTLTDFEIVGSPAIFDENPEYDKVDRSDGQMWGMPTFFREMLLKSGLWNAEELFQYDSAMFRQYYAKSNKKYGKSYYKNLKLVAQDIDIVEKGKPDQKVAPLKPIITGYKTGVDYIDTVLDKMSTFPLFFTFTEEGSHLREHFIQNFEQNMDYSVVLTSRKKGAQELHNFYNGDGTVNTSKISEGSIFTIQNNAFGIQVETAPHDDNSQTRGTQATKLAGLNIFENGVPIDYIGKKDWFSMSEELKKKSSPLYAELKHNESLLNELTSIGYTTLLRELGITDGGGKFSVTDHKRLSEKLYDEIVSREANQNVYDSVKLNDKGVLNIAPEASNNYQIIKNILLSIVDKNVVSPKMHGGAKIMASSAMWDIDSSIVSYIKKGKEWVKVEDYNSLSPADKEKVRLFSTRLKFYSKNPDGTTSPCEILLPNWFKRKLQKSPKLKNKSDIEIIEYLNNTEEGRKILTGAGFRIPTQEVNSIEVFKVAGFLSENLGDTVIVPAEITKKSGGDFDVDKLNTYLKNVYVDAKGDLRIVPYLGQGDTAIENFRSLISKDNLLSLFNLPSVRDKFEAADLNREGDYDDFSEEEELAMAKTDEELAHTMYKQSIQNEYVESFERIMLAPQNYDRLLLPNSDHGMKELNRKLQTLIGKQEEKTVSPLLSLTYINDQRQLTLSGKDNVAIGAIAQVNHSLTQRQPVYIDPERVKTTYEKDKKWLGDAIIKLDHNKVEIDGKSYTSLSGRLDKAKQFISDKISAYLNGFVDITKDTFIAELGVNRSNAGIFLFLERIGVPNDIVIYFMNQPIIREYYKLLNRQGTTYLFNEDNVDTMMSQFDPMIPTDQLPEDINIKELSINIEKYYKDKKEFNSVENAQQQLILSEFLKYAKMANQLREHIQAVTWDTTNFSDFTLLEIKKILLGNVKKYSIFNTPEAILNNSFLGPLKDKISKSSEAIGSFLKLQVGQGQRAILKTLYPLIDPKDNYRSPKEAIKLGNKVTASFVDFLMQTKSNIYGSPLGIYIKRLLTDDVNGAAYKLKDIKDDPDNTLNQNYAIASLSYMIGEQEGQVSNLRLKLPTKDIFSQNAFIQGMEELKDIDIELYRGIVFASVLQSGTYKSYMSFTDLLPLQDFAAMINPILDQVRDDESLEWFNTNSLFLKNNWQDKDFVPQSPYILKSKAGKWYFPWQISSYWYQKPYENFTKITSNPLEHPIFVSRYRQEAGAPLITIKRNNTIDYTDKQIRQYSNRGDWRHKIIVGYQPVMDGNEIYTIYDKENPAFDKFVYKPVNLYGDGVKAQEYYEDNRPSQINNGTLHLDQELTDEQVIQSFEGNVQPTVIKKPVAVTYKTPVKTIVPANVAVQGMVQVPAKTGADNKGGFMAKLNMKKGPCK